MVAEQSDHKGLNDKEHQRRDAFHEFVYAVTHDIRAPIRQISGFAGLLRGKLDPTDEETSEYLEHIMAGTRRANSLLDDLIEYSRIEDHRINRSDCDSQECCEAALEAAGLLSEEAVTIDTGPLPHVHTDRAHLIRVFCHLFNNARAFGPRPLQIKIEAEPDGDFCIFSVTDNGPGIPAQSAERIFDVFVVLDRSHEGAGNGIGLACVRRICRQQEGDAWLAQTSSGGTTIRFSLPLST